jgi:hypothetical protein
MATMTTNYCEKGARYIHDGQTLAKSILDMQYQTFMHKRILHVSLITSPDRRLKTNRRSYLIVYFSPQKCLGFQATIYHKQTRQTELCLCDVTLSVYPHRAGLKNMPGHGGIRTCDLWTSYSPEYITPTQQISN